jgi:hypothetical protein
VITLTAHRARLVPLPVEDAVAELGAHEHLLVRRALEDASTILTRHLRRPTSIAARVAILVDGDDEALVRRDGTGPAERLDVGRIELRLEAALGGSMCRLELTHRPPSDHGARLRERGVGWTANSLALALILDRTCWRLRRCARQAT